MARQEQAPFVPPPHLHPPTPVGVRARVGGGYGRPFSVSSFNRHTTLDVFGSGGTGISTFSGKKKKPRLASFWSGGVGRGGGLWFLWDKQGESPKLCTGRARLEQTLWLPAPSNSIHHPPAGGGAGGAWGGLPGTLKIKGKDPCHSPFPILEFKWKRLADWEEERGRNSSVFQQGQIGRAHV